MLIAFSAVFVTLLLLYFIVIAPLVKKRAEANTPKVEPPTLLNGEALDEDGSTILVFPYAQRKQMAKIEVKNQYGEFTCYKAEKSEDFFFLGHEQAPLSPETLSSLVVAAGYTATVERTAESCEDWGLYGLGEHDAPAWYRLTLLDGTTHEMYIGNKIPSGGGYYCRYAGRDALYVLAASIESTLLVPLETLVTPYLGYILDNKTYSYVEDFVMQKNGENFIYISYDGTTQETEDAVFSVYDMHYPGKYTVNDTKYSEVLLSFCGLQGYSTLKVGAVDKMLHEDEEIMAQYGFSDISNPSYEIYYKYGDAESLILFTESGVDGFYFAYSYLYNLIALVQKTTVPYLEWELMDFMHPQIFHESINDVAKIEISGTVSDARGDKEINETFILDGEANTIQITAQSTGKLMTEDLLRNYRQFYLVMLQLMVQGYMKNEGVEDYSSLDEIACFKVTMDNGEELVYRYYSYSSRRCYVTVNGEGEFYVNKKDVYKVLCDANRAAHGLTVDRYAETSDYVE